MEAVNKFYLCILGGSCSCKELGYKEWVRLLSLYDGVQDVKRVLVPSEIDVMPDLDIYVSGANGNLIFIKKRWVR